jgi:hypothetical protein
MNGWTCAGDARRSSRHPGSSRRRRRRCAGCGAGPIDLPGQWLGGTLRIDTLIGCSAGRTDTVPQCTARPPTHLESVKIMPYERNTWTAAEILRALSNPIHAAGAPHAHSSKHAVSGELARNPLYQKARTTAVIHDGKHRDSNIAAQQALNQQKLAGTLSNTQYKKQMAQVPLPEPEVGRHSTLNDVAIANALSRAFNDGAMRPHLHGLDAGADTKVHLNFSGTIGTGNSTRRVNRRGPRRSIPCSSTSSRTPATAISRSSRRSSPRSSTRPAAPTPS